MLLKINSKENTINYQSVTKALAESLANEYEGEPQTSWERIAKKIYNEFICYLEDEVSGDLYEQIDGQDEFLYRLHDFVVWLDINEYDH